MSRAYRCSECGQFRDGDAALVVDYCQPNGADDAYQTVELCPECAPDLLAALEHLAAFEHAEKA